MRVAIDHRLCDGCGLCASFAPHAFVRLEDGLAYPVGHHDVLTALPPRIVSGEVADGSRAAALEAVDACPEDCITVSEVEESLDQPQEATDPAEARRLAVIVRSRFEGAAYDRITRIGLAGDDICVWTESKSYHRVPLG